MEMLKAGFHFGHQKSKWHPKMASYIFGVRNGVHIVDLEITQKKLAEALEFLASVAERGGTALFVGTKRQAQAIVEREAMRAGVPYVNVRWLGGTLTNFSVIHALIKTHRDLARGFESGEFAVKYTKKEQLMFRRKMAEIEAKAGGILSLDKIPDTIFVVDIKKEKTAVNEAVAKRVPLVAICDTNVDPTEIAYPIPANDDAVGTIDLITKLVADAVLEGKARRAAGVVAPAAPAVTNAAEEAVSAENQE